MKRIVGIIIVAILLHACQNKVDKYLNSGKQKKDQGDYLGAIEEYKKGLLIYPEDAILYNNLGVSYEKVTLYKEAYEALSKSITYKPDDWLTYYNRARLSLTLNDTLASLNDCNMSIKLNSNATISYALKARILNGKKNYQESIQLLLPFTQKHKDDIVYMCLGNSYYELNRISEALQYYRNAAELKPNVIEYKKKIAECFNILNQSDRAMKILDELLANNRNDAELYFMAGFTAQKLNKLDRAIELYSASINIDSNNYSAYVKRAYCYDFSNDFNSAIKDFSSALKIDSFSSFIYFERGIAKMNAKQIESAYVDINKAIELGSDTAKAFVDKYPKDYMFKKLEKINEE